MKKTMIAAALIGGLFAVPAFAATESECKDMWTKADTNGDGVLTGAEGMRYTAYMRIKGETGVTERISSDVFMKACQGDVFKTAATDAGAPLKGSNSFTEGQAKDRIIAAGYTNVSELKKDADGIWRGTATKGGMTMDVRTGASTPVTPGATVPATPGATTPATGMTTPATPGAATDASVNVAVDYKGNVVTY